MLTLFLPILAATTASYLRAAQMDTDASAVEAVHGRWLQVYSDRYVQSTSEIDYSCVTAEIARANTSKPAISISKHAYQHGNIHQPVHWSQTYTLSWTLDGTTSLQDNLVLVPLVTTSSVLVPLWLRRSGDNYMIWTGMDNKTMYVWVHELPKPAENAHILQQLAELDFNGTWKTPLSSYSESCLSLK